MCLATRVYVESPLRSHYLGGLIDPWHFTCCAAPAAHVSTTPARRTRPSGCCMTFHAPQRGATCTCVESTPALLRRSDRAVTVYSLAPRKRRSSNQLAPFAYHAMCLADTRRSKPSMAHPMSRSFAAQQHISMTLQVRMSTVTALSSQVTTISHFDPCPIHP